MNYYILYNTYADIIKDSISIQATNTVNYGTAMINKRRKKKNRRN